MLKLVVTSIILISTLLGKSALASSVEVSRYTKNLLLNDNVFWFAPSKDGEPFDGSSIQKFSSEFVHSKGSSNFGYMVDPLWFRISLTNSGLIPINKFLTFDDYAIGHVEFYIYTDNLLLTSGVAGNNVPPSHRPMKMRRVVFPINLDSEQTVHVYVRIKTTNIMHSSMRLLDEETLQSKEQVGHWFLGLYYGCVLAILAYNLFLFGSTKERSFSYYSIFVMLTSATLFTLDGFADFFFPVGGWETMLSSFGCLAIAAGLNFSRQFLQLQTTMPWMNRAVVIGIFGSLVVALLAQTVTSDIANSLTDLVLVYGCLVVISAGIQSVRKGSISARYFLVSWIILVPFCLIWACMLYDLLPYSYLTMYGVHIGSGFEMILMSLALGNRINTISQQRDDAETRAHNNAIVARSAQMVAHDVRKPFALFNTMLRSIDSAVETREIRATVAQYVPNIKATIAEAELMLNGLMSSDRKGKIQNVTYSLRGVIEKSIERSFASSNEDKEIVAVDFFELDDIFVSTISESNLVRVFTNLIENAAQSAGKYGQVLIACRMSSGNITVDVKDNGPGVCPSLEGRLFQHFATTKVNGHGLGLPVVKELLEDAGGKVSYERQDKWTVFSVSFLGGEPKAKKQMTFSSMVELKKNDHVRIVVVDDCVFTREAWQREVKDAEVSVAASPEELNDWNIWSSATKDNTIIVTDLWFGSDDVHGITKVLALSDQQNIPIVISSNAFDIDQRFPQVKKIKKRPYSWQDLRKIL